MSDSKSQSEATEGRIRYVVLFHRQHEGDHFDLMIENGETLATWKMDLPPETVTEVGLKCCRIAEHRGVYLDYEGPISGNRGIVTRHDQGYCKMSVTDIGDWCGRFDGQKLSGKVELRRDVTPAGAWTLHYSRE